MVLDACYPSLDSFSLQNFYNDAWTGRIIVTFGSKNIQVFCNKCTGEVFNDQITVDGNADSEDQSSVYCHDGFKCVFTVANDGNKKLFYITQVVADQMQNISRSYQT